MLCVWLSDLLTLHCAVVKASSKIPRKAGSVTPAVAVVEPQAQTRERTMDDVCNMYLSARMFAFCLFVN